MSTAGSAAPLTPSSPRTEPSRCVRWLCFLRRLVLPGEVDLFGVPRLRSAMKLWVPVVMEPVHCQGGCRDFNAASWVAEFVDQLVLVECGLGLAKAWPLASPARSSPRTPPPPGAAALGAHVNALLAAFGSILVVLRGQAERGADQVHDTPAGPVVSTSRVLCSLAGGIGVLGYGVMGLSLSGPVGAVGAIDDSFRFPTIPALATASSAALISGPSSAKLTTSRAYKAELAANSTLPPCPGSAADLESTASRKLGEAWSSRRLGSRADCPYAGRASPATHWNLRRSTCSRACRPPPPDCLYTPAGLRPKCVNVAGDAEGLGGSIFNESRVDFRS
jgi:hypothetical protein